MQLSFPAHVKSPARALAAPHVLDLTLIAGLILLVVMASLPLAPSLRPIGRDNGIQSYTAEVVFEGGTLYRDAWDNKLPGVYLINVLAFELFGTDSWAIWTIDVLFLSATAALFFALLRLAQFPRRVAPVAAGLFVVLARHPLVLHDVNFTESYALLPQVLVFLLGYRFLRRPTIRWAFLIGLSASLAFLLKQTTVGGALALIPALMLMRHPVVRAPQRWRWLGAIIIGGVSGLGMMALYLGANGILRMALHASIAMPLAFHEWVSAQSVSALDTITGTLTRSVAPALLFLVAGLVVPGLRAVFTHRRFTGLTPRQRERVALGGWAALTVLADLALVNLTNRSYAHYYVTLAPALALLAALGLQRLVEPPRGLLRRVLRRGLAASFIVLNLLAFGVGVAIEVSLTATGSLLGPTQEHPAVAYVEQHTRPEETVFVWGASSEINFEAQRHSPTQYHYGYPLIVPGHTTRAQIAELVSDLRTSQPALIVDTTVEDGQRIPPLDVQTRAAWLAGNGRADTADLTLLFDFVSAHCAAEYQAGEVTIYRCEYR
ncbi:MAG: glycosyltransferase family 39 protein [Anaerolineae bacterium]|nr:glycosyltransferase family 39 protein [Anaerolineae bacterium]